MSVLFMIFVICYVVSVFYGVVDDGVDMCCYVDVLQEIGVVLGELVDYLQVIFDVEGDGFRVCFLYYNCVGVIVYLVGCDDCVQKVCDVFVCVKGGVV